MTSNSTPRNIPQKLKMGIQTKMRIGIFIAALFTITKRCKQPKCPATDEQLNKMWYIHTVQYYLAIKKNEVLTNAT